MQQSPFMCVQLKAVMAETEELKKTLDKVQKDSEEHRSKLEKELAAKQAEIEREREEEEKKLQDKLKQ